MTLSRRVSLDGVELDSLDERILISLVDDQPPEESRNAANVYAGDGIGSRQTARHISSKKVIVKFRLRINKRDYESRAKLLERINAWAKSGGEMRSSTRPDRKIRVRCTQRAAFGDPREWTKEYQLTFEANEKPYWEHELPNTAVSANTTNVTLDLQADGELDTVLNAEALNASGAEISTVTLTSGGRKIKLTSLGLAAQEALVIDHTDMNVLRIRIRNAAGNYRSVLGKRTEDSADEILLSPGNNSVKCEASRACRFSLSCTGRFC